MSATLTRRLRRAATGVLCTAAVALPLSLVGAAVAQAKPVPHAPRVAAFTNLTLRNGWHAYGFGTARPAVHLASGIVQFKGAMATKGANLTAFTLPRGLRPATDVYVPVDLCDSAEGRLFIKPTGVVSVQFEDLIGDAQCFTSLDGASFARSGSGFTSLKLLNGWKNAPFRTSRAQARVISGIVHLTGAIATAGTSPAPFTLPKGFRPATPVWVNADTCNGTNGRLKIGTNGHVTLQAENSFGEMTCFTSLDGVTFPRSGSGFTSLKLLNGWKNRAFGAATVGARLVSGTVELRGGMSTAGTDDLPFTLPKSLRPGHIVYVPVDLCNAHYGRVEIEPNGESLIEINAETSTWANAQCFTSFEGASFAR